MKTRVILLASVVAVVLAGSASAQTSGLGALLRREGVGVDLFPCEGGAPFGYLRFRTVNRGPGGVTGTYRRIADGWETPFSGELLSLWTLNRLTLRIGEPAYFPLVGATYTAYLSSQAYDVMVAGTYSDHYFLMSEGVVDAPPRRVCGRTVQIP